MKNMKLPAMLFMAALLGLGTAQASEHHSGHNGGGADGGSGSGCVRPKLSKFLPAHLATVAPGSEFSFVAGEVDSPQVTVFVKKIPVDVTTEFVDPFYRVKGKLPAELVNTAARIEVKVVGRSPHCVDEKGWLVKISEK